MRFRCRTNEHDYQFFNGFDAYGSPGFKVLLGAGLGTSVRRTASTS